MENQKTQIKSTVIVSAKVQCRTGLNTRVAKSTPDNKNTCKKSTLTNLTTYTCHKGTRWKFRQHYQIQKHNCSVQQN